MERTAYVYVIGSKEHLVEPYEHCYIGVTLYPGSRWKGHAKSEYPVGLAIRENDWTMQENFKIIWSGSQDDCYLLERDLRPSSYMGLNEKRGGRGQWPITEERNHKISKALKGRQCTWGNKVSKTKIEKKLHVGSKNGRAQRWKFISPSGEEYSVVGEFGKFCEEHKLLPMALYNNIGKKIESPVYGKMGGFRPKTLEHKVLRENTTGWTVFKEISS